MQLHSRYPSTDTTAIQSIFACWLPCSNGMRLAHGTHLSTLVHYWCLLGASLVPPCNDGDDHEATDDALFPLPEFLVSVPSSLLLLPSSLFPLPSSIFHLPSARPVLSCHALSCLALPLPCLVLSCLALPCLVLPCLALPCLALVSVLDPTFVYAAYS